MWKSNGATISFPNSPVNCTHNLQSTFLFSSYFSSSSLLSDRNMRRVWPWMIQFVIMSSLCRHSTVCSEAFAPSINVSFVFYFCRIHKWKWSAKQTDILTPSEWCESIAIMHWQRERMALLAKEWESKWILEMKWWDHRKSHQVQLETSAIFPTHRLGKGCARAVHSRLEKKSVRGHRERWDIHTGGVRLQILFLSRQSVQGWDDSLLLPFLPFLFVPWSSTTPICSYQPIFFCPLKSILTPQWEVTAQGKVKFEIHKLIQVTSCWMYKFMSQEALRSFFLTELNKTSPHHKPIVCLFKKTNKRTQAASMKQIYEWFTTRFWPSFKFFTPQW